MNQSPIHLPHGCGHGATIDIVDTAATAPLRSAVVGWCPRTPRKPVFHAIPAETVQNGRKRENTSKNTDLRGNPHLALATGAGAGGPRPYFCHGSSHPTHTHHGYGRGPQASGDHMGGRKISYFFFFCHMNI